MSALSTFISNIVLYKYWPIRLKDGLRWRRSLASIRRLGVHATRDHGKWTLTKGGCRIIVPADGLPHFHLLSLAKKHDSLFACPELAGNGDTLDATELIQFCGCTVSCSAVSLMEVEIALKAYNRHCPLLQGQTVLDVGAFEGMYSIYAAKQVGPGGRVIALEPDSKNLKALRENISRNNLTQVEVVAEGLWCEDGSVSFVTNDSGSGIVGDAHDQVGSIRVTTLARLIERERIECLDFVKMDIEGAEVEVLENCASLLPSLRATWAIATYHIREGVTTAQTIETIFTAAGYGVATENPEHLTTYAQPR